MYKQFVLEWIKDVTSPVAAEGLTALIRLLTRGRGPKHVKPLPSHPDDEDGHWGGERESLRFMTRQRNRHRIALAKEKWELLRVVTHYHPSAGRPDRLLRLFHPRLLSGFNTVADFASGKLLHEDELDESAPSQVRRRLVESSLERIRNLADTLQQVEEVITAAPEIETLPKPDWLSALCVIPWAGLFEELSGKRFSDKPQLKSYCGFKRLTTVVDTPCEGIHARPDEECNLNAYAAAMEIALNLSRSGEAFADVYQKHLDVTRPFFHQFALRKTAVKVLDRTFTFLHLPKTA